MRKDAGSSEGYDYFGTFLRAVQSKTIANRLLESLFKGSMHVSDLAKKVGGTADELVDAIIRAEESGYIIRAKTDDETTISLTDTGRKLVGMARKETG